MRRAIWTCILSALLALPVSVAAQNGEGPGFNAGDVEFTLSGNGNSDKDVRRTQLSASASLGVFIVKPLEVLVRQEVNFLDPNGDNDVFNGSTRLAADLHLPLGRLYPFIGGNIGYVYGDAVDDQFIAGPEAGLKLFLTDSAFAFALAEYQFLFEDEDQLEENFEDGRFVYGIGLGVKF